MNINQIIAEELKIGLHQVDATVELIDGGNTIPFIARYRKEVTGGLNDEVLRNLDERLTYLRNLEEKKTSVITQFVLELLLTELLLLSQDRGHSCGQKGYSVDKRNVPTIQTPA